MKSNLIKRGFLSLIVTQFFGAANDNVLKQVLTFMVATGIWANALGEGGQSYVGLCLTLPFIFLSGYAGQIADRVSKRRVIVAVKIAEVPIAIIAMVGFWMQSLWLTLAAMLLLATQSAFFGPAKYGVIPELVDDSDLSRANGTINMLTNVAIILGALVGGPLADLYHPKPDKTGAVAEPLLWIPGAALLCIAIAGLFTSLAMPRMKAQDPGLRFDWNPIGTYLKAVVEMARGPMLIVAAAWSFFYMIGMMALLALPKYEHILQITYTQTSYLLGVLGISIACGSITAGLVSGHAIRPILIPIGAGGMAASFLMLGTVQPEFWSVAIMLFAAGFFAGFYIIPLQALLQKLSPTDERGRFLGTANAISFCFSSLGSVLYLILVNRIGMPANRVFLVCSGLIVIITGYVIWRLRPILRRHAIP